MAEKITEAENLTPEICLKGKLPRNSKGNKGTFGKTLLLCGSKEYPGAGIMAAKGALRSGAGIVKLCMPDSLQGSLPFYLDPAIIFNLISSQNGGFCLNLQEANSLCLGFNSVLAGCGWGKGKERLQTLRSIAQSCKTNLVLDADALNIIAENNAYDILSSTEASVIITPHLKEFQRLLHTDIMPTTTEEAAKLAYNFSRKHKVITVLKSYNTVITDGEYCCQCLCPNSGLAKGGSGDLLAGLIAGMAASNMYSSPLYAAINGVYVHSLAGKLASETYGEESMLISEVSDQIPQAIKQLNKNL